MRMTLAEIIERRGRINWEKVNATADEDIARHAKEDGPVTQKKMGWMLIFRDLPIRHPQRCGTS